MSYPPIPNQYKGYLADAVHTAEIALHDEHGDDAIPGTFKTRDHIPHELVEAVISRESGWNPQAVNQSGYCNNRGGRATGLGQFCLNPGGDIGGSLELSDFQTITGQKVTPADVYDPKKSIMLVAFGLGDRYERMKKDNNDTPKNWIKAVEGYSPVPGNSPETQAYEKDIYDYIATNYSKSRADEIQGGAGGSTEDCSRYKFYDPRHGLCEAGLIASIGKTAVAGGEQAVINAYLAYLKKFIVLFAGVAAIGFGLLLLSHKRAAQFIKDNPEVVAAV